MACIQPPYYDDASDTQIITKIAIKFPFSTVVLKCGKLLFGTFCLIYLNLNLIDENILLKNMIAIT